MKWRPYIAATPQSVRPFDSEDLDQFALEGLMIVAGLLDMPGCGVNKGKLRELEAKGGERWVQRAIDLYVQMRCGNAVKKVRTEKRTADLVYLDTPTAEGGSYGDAMANGMETSSVTVPDVGKRYPILWHTRVVGRQWWEVARDLGLTQPEYLARRDRELAAFTTWAKRNHRVSSDVKVA